eukprot:606531-Amphidinium_carterae.2
MKPNATPDSRGHKRGRLSPGPDGLKPLTGFTNPPARAHPHHVQSFLWNTRTNTATIKRGLQQADHKHEVATQAALQRYGNTTILELEHYLPAN